jgi:hypothetical protein
MSSLENSIIVDGHTIIRQAGDILATPLDGELVMLNLETGHYHGMDDIASYIWEVCVNPISIADLCSLLIERYDVGYDDCYSDTLSFINDLVRDGLLITGEI